MSVVSIFDSFNWQPRVVAIPALLGAAGFKVAQAFAAAGAKVLLEDFSGKSRALGFEELLISRGLEPLLLQRGSAERGWINSRAALESEIARLSGIGNADASRKLSHALDHAHQVDVPNSSLQKLEATAGKVWLIGGGPGDPKLLTQAAIEALAIADVIFLDRLGVALNVFELAPGATVVDVGKAPGRHKLSQEKINTEMALLAQAGAKVARLKGGDVFVFGRGGEEWQHLAEAGIQVKIIPGITSALAVPGLAGISATHREITRACTIISGHQPFNAKELQALHDLGSTIIILMGVATLPSTIHGLISAGMPADTGIAILEQGFTELQKATFSTLKTAISDMQNSGVQNPAVIVIGEVVTNRVKHSIFDS